MGAVLTIPQLTILIQVPVSVFLARRGGIKKVSILSWMILKPLFILLGLVPLLGSDLPAGAALVLAVLVMLVASSLMWIGDIGLNIWFGSMIPPACKGRFFSTRQRMITLFNVGFALLIAGLLPALQDNPYKYTILFGLAGLSGILDAVTYVRIRPPEGAFQPLQRALGRPVRLRSFAEPFRDRRYRPFLGFSILWYFALSLAGPYFNVFMLQTIGSSLGEQTIYMQIIPGLATFLFIRRTGRLNDLYGNRPVMLLSAGIVCCLPLLWLMVTPNTMILVAVANILGGIFAATIDLSVLNMSIFFSDAERRSVYLTARSISTILLGVVPAMLLGGLLSDTFGNLLADKEIAFVLGQRLNSFHILLMLSIGLRVTAVLVFGRRITEETAVPVRRMTGDILARQKFFWFKSLLGLVHVLSFFYHRIRAIRRLFRKRRGA